MKRYDECQAIGDSMIYFPFSENELPIHPPTLSNHVIQLISTDVLLQILQEL